MRGEGWNAYILTYLHKMMHGSHKVQAYGWIQQSLAEASNVLEGAQDLAEQNLLSTHWSYQ